MSQGLDSVRIELSKKFLLEAEGHQRASNRAEEPAAEILRVYTHLMGFALDRQSESCAYKKMSLEIQELTTPDAWSYIRMTQPYAAQALLSLKSSIGQFETALHPSPGIYQ